MERGKIITIEGTGDRVGKHTQSTLLTNWLLDQDIPTKCISFPMYGTPQAKMVEQHLTGELKLNAIEAVMAYAIDRSVTYRELELEKFLNEGGYIVFDRYTESNAIYQVARDMLKRNTSWIIDTEALKVKERIYHIERDLLGLPKSDVVIFLQLDRWLNDQLLEKDNGKESGDAYEQNTNLLNLVAEVGKSTAIEEGWNIILCNKGEEILPIGEINKSIQEVIKGIL